MTVVEQLIGRPLRQAEEAIDIVRLDRALAAAKDELDDAIQAEMLHAVERWRDLDLPPILRVTAEMIEPLQDLHDLGIEEAKLELERLGYPARTFAHAREPAPHGPGDLAGYLARNLPALTVHIEAEFVRADLSSLAADAIARALLRIPGGRDIASRLVSTALIGGLAQTFEEVADEISCWEYTSVLDGGTCPICRPLDGTRYRTLAELFAVLPNFGPNPLCLGGGRCRCRAVPCLPGDTVVAPPPEPPSAPPFRDRFNNELRRHLAEEVEPVWQALDELLVLPADRGPTRLQIEQDDTMRFETSGVFQHYRNGAAIRISLNPGRESAATTLSHELGHYLDHTFLGSSQTEGATRFDPILDRWREAVVASRARQQLLALKTDPHLRGGRAHVGYLLEAKEVFARSFAQWVALRSGSLELRRQIDEDLAGAASATQVYLPRQWAWDDFEPIAAAFDELFATAGLLRPSARR